MVDVNKTPEMPEMPVTPELIASFMDVAKVIVDLPEKMASTLDEFTTRLGKVLDKASKESKSNKSSFGSFGRSSFAKGASPDDYVKMYKYSKSILSSSKDLDETLKKIRTGNALLYKAEKGGYEQSIKTYKLALKSLWNHSEVEKKLLSEISDLKEISEKYEEINKFAMKYSKQLGEIDAKKYLKRQSSELLDAKRALEMDTELWKNHSAELTKNMKKMRQIGEQQEFLNKKTTAFNQGYSTVSGTLVNGLQVIKGWSKEGGTFQKVFKGIGKEGGNVQKILSGIGKEGGTFQKILGGAQNATVALSGPISSLASTIGILSAGQSWSQAANFQKNTVNMGTAMGGLADSSGEVTKHLQQGALEASRYSDGFVSALDATTAQNQLFGAGIKDLDAQNTLMKASANSAAELNMSFDSVVTNAGELAFDLKLTGGQSSSILRSVSNIARQFGFSGQKVWDMVKSSGKFLENMRKTGTSSAVMISNMTELKASLERSRGASEIGDAIGEAISKGGIEALTEITEKIGPLGVAIRSNVSQSTIQGMMAGDVTSKGQIELINSTEQALSRLYGTSVSYQGFMTNQAIRGNRALLRNMLGLEDAKDGIDIDRQIEKIHKLKGEYTGLTSGKDKTAKTQEMNIVLNSMGENVHKQFMDMGEQLSDDIKGLSSKSASAIVMSQQLLTKNFAENIGGFEKYTQAMKDAGKVVPKDLQKHYDALTVKGGPLDIQRDAKGGITSAVVHKGKEKEASDALESFGKDFASTQDEASKTLASQATKNAIDAARKGVNQGQNTVMNGQLDVLNSINSSFESWVVKWATVTSVAAGTASSILLAVRAIALASGVNMAGGLGKVAAAGKGLLNWGLGGALGGGEAVAVGAGAAETAAVGTGAAVAGTEAAGGAAAVAGGVGLAAIVTPILVILAGAAATYGIWKLTKKILNKGTQEMMKNEKKLSDYSGQSKEFKTIELLRNSHADLLKQSNNKDLSNIFEGKKGVAESTFAEVMNDPKRKADFEKSMTELIQQQGKEGLTAEIRAQAILKNEADTRANNGQLPPKMHGGGIVAPDEVIRTLQVGEGVIPKEEMQRLTPVSPGFGGSQMPTVPGITPDISTSTSKNSDALEELNAKQVELLKALVENTRSRPQGPMQISGADASSTPPRPRGSLSSSGGSAHLDTTSWMYSGGYHPAMSTPGTGAGNGS